MDQKRRRIAIILNFRKGWMGGIVYIINLINSLNTLDDNEQPEIIVFYNRDLAQFIPEIQYPHLKTLDWNFYGFVKGYCLSLMNQKNMFVEQIVTDYKPDGIYPLNDWPVSGKQYLKKGTRIVAWIPDLQHKFYPNFFKKTRVYFRELRIKLMLRNTNDLAVSSNDVEGHFRKFYNLKPSLRIHSMRFVSDIKLPVGSVNEVLKQYKIPPSYFIISNQFTNHKNHLLVFKALSLLAKQNKQVHIVFTGKMDFKGNENYIAEIRKFIADEKLENMISLLGIIPRKDQVMLMKHSQAIIQPSLFEGWSTVIEDAKTLGVQVIASDLPVNIEQLQSAGTYFNRFDENDLASKIAAFEKRAVQYEPYQSRAQAFAKSFVNIFSEGK